VNNRWLIGVFALCTLIMAGAFLRIAGHVQHVSEPAFLSLGRNGIFTSHNAEDSTYYGTSKIQHPSDADTPEAEVEEVTIRSRVDDCESNWLSQLTASFHWPFAGQTKQGKEPMSVKNARHHALTLKMIPGRPHRRSSWAVAPGYTWKSHTEIGQKWLLEDHGRCLFYVTAGDEPLQMVVRSQ
jgi:hypothetical protein